MSQYVAISLLVNGLRASASVGALFIAVRRSYVGAMTLTERLALAREIATRTPTRIVIDNSRDEARRMRFGKAKARTKALAKRKPK